MAAKKLLCFGLVICLLVVQRADSKCSIISSRQWGARAPISVEYAIKPVEYVVIHHTVTPSCDDEDSCSELLSNIQSFHMDELKFSTIGYNFMIGGDGNVYEGTGWHKVGAHTRGYNTRSLGIAFVGNFVKNLPNTKQLNAAQNFLKCAVKEGELDSRYKLIGGRQVSSTMSPGLKLYQEIQTWPHFVDNPKVKQ